MFVLQRVQDAQQIFTPHTFRADIYADVRSNYGLTETEFLEFLTQTYFERPNLFLTYWEGELPEIGQGLSERAKAAKSAQAAAKARR